MDADDYSKLLALNWLDVKKGLIVTAYATVCFALMSFPTTSADLIVLARFAGSTLGGYFIKQLSTNSQNKMFKAEPKPVV